jgi:TetR/AcrR family transcriptional regulator
MKKEKNNSPKKLSRKEKERLWKRQHVFSAAMRLFSEKGYRNVSMPELADASEFAIATLYTFFKSKEDLYMALIMDIAQDHYRTFMDVLMNKNVKPAIRIENYILSRIRIFNEKISVYRLYFAETHGASINLRAGLNDDVRLLYQKVLDQLASVFKEGIDAGIFKRLPPQYLSSGLDGLINGFIAYWLENASANDEAADAQLIMEMFFNPVWIHPDLPAKKDS